MLCNCRSLLTDQSSVLFVVHTGLAVKSPSAKVSESCASAVNAGNCSRSRRAGRLILQVDFGCGTTDADGSPISITCCKKEKFQYKISKSDLVSNQFCNTFAFLCTERNIQNAPRNRFSQGKPCNVFVCQYNHRPSQNGRPFVYPPLQERAAEQGKRFTIHSITQKPDASFRYKKSSASKRGWGCKT